MVVTGLIGFFFFFSLFGFLVPLGFWWAVGNGGVLSIVVVWWRLGCLVVERET